MKFIKGSEKKFIQNKKYVLDFYDSVGIKNESLINIINDNPFALFDECLLVFKNETFQITHFLLCSNEIGYDIKKANIHLNLNDEIAFAMTLGDNPICFNKKTKKISLLFMDSEDEKLELFDTLDQFINNIKFN